MAGSCNRHDKATTKNFIAIPDDCWPTIAITRIDLLVNELKTRGAGNRPLSGPNLSVRDESRTPKTSIPNSVFVLAKSGAVLLSWKTLSAIGTLNYVNTAQSSADRPNRTVRARGRSKFGPKICLSCELSCFRKFNAEPWFKGCCCVRNGLNLRVQERL